MLQSQLVDLVFTGGVDTKTDDKNTLFTNFKSIENYRVDKTGALIPRGGFTYKSIESSIEETRFAPPFGAVANSNTNIQLTNGLSWRIASSSTATGKEIIAGSEVRGSVKRQVFGVNTSGLCAVAYGNNRVCTVWRDSANLGLNRVYVALQDTDGVDVVQSTYDITVSSTHAGIITAHYVNGSFVILCSTSSSGTAIAALKVQEQETQVLVPLTFSAPASSYPFSACVAGNNLVIGTGTGNNVLLSSYTLSGTTLTLASSATATSGSASPVRFSLSAMNNNLLNATIAVSGTNGTNYTYLQFFDSALVQQGLTVSTTSASGNANMWIAQRDYERIAFGMCAPSGAKFFDHRRYYYDMNTMALTADPVITHGAYLIAEPLYIDNRLMAPVETLTTATYGSQGLLEYVETTGISDPGALFGVSKNTGRGPQTALGKVAIGNSQFFIPCTMVSSTESIPVAAGSSGFFGVVPTFQASYVSLNQLEYPAKMLDSSNNQRLLLGNVPRAASVYRQIATPWPELHVTVSDLAIIPGTVAAGTYSIVFAKAITLPNGTVYRTYTPIYVAVLTSVQNISWTKLAGDSALAGAPGSATVSLEVYHTEANGSVFYQSQGSGGGIISGGPALTSGRLADINGGELYPEPPAAIRTAVQWKDRIAAVMADRGTVVKFSKPTVFPQGTTFADGLEIDVGTDGGDITALGVMDHTLYIFKRNSILTLSGDPPGPTGQNGTLSSPTVLRSGLGTIDPRSVLLTPRGLMFNTQKGIYIMGRNQEWQFNGDGPYTDRVRTMTGASVDETQSEVYFTFENGLWAYNYDTNQWYKWNTPDTSAGVAVCNGTLFVNSYFGYGAYSKSQAVDTAYFEGDLLPTTYQIPTIFETGWLTPGHIRGFQRIKRLYMEGKSTASGTLTISVYTDYSAVPSQTFTLPYGIDDTLQFDLHIAAQKSEAIRFRVYAPNASLTFSGATLELGVKQGRDKSRTTNITG